jgi:hypothetical protein
VILVNAVFEFTTNSIISPVARLVDHPVKVELVFF